MREREKEREREREKERSGNSRAIDVQLFDVAFFCLLYVYIFWICYKSDVISSNANRSVVRIMQGK